MPLGIMHIKKHYRFVNSVIERRAGSCRLRTLNNIICEATIFTKKTQFRGQASKLLTSPRNAFQTCLSQKQTVPPPRLYWVAIRLMSPIQTYFNLLFGIQRWCFLTMLLTAHLE